MDLLHRDGISHETQSMISGDLNMSLKFLLQLLTSPVQMWPTQNSGICSYSALWSGQELQAKEAKRMVHINPYLCFSEINTSNYFSQVTIYARCWYYFCSIIKQTGQWKAVPWFCTMVHSRLHGEEKQQIVITFGTLGLIYSTSLADKCHQVVIRLSYNLHLFRKYVCIYSIYCSFYVCLVIYKADIVHITKCFTSVI